MKLRKDWYSLCREEEEKAIQSREKLMSLKEEMRTCGNLDEYHRLSRESNRVFWEHQEHVRLANKAHGIWLRQLAARDRASAAKMAGR